MLPLLTRSRKKCSKKSSDIKLLAALAASASFPEEDPDLCSAQKKPLPEFPPTGANLTIRWAGGYAALCFSP